MSTTITRRQRDRMKTEAQLLAPYIDRWTITAHPDGLHGWTATRRTADGKHIRCLAELTARQLATSLAHADPEETHDHP